MVPAAAGTVGWCRRAPQRTSISSMFRATRITMPSIRPSHLATGLLAALLLFSIEGVVPQPTDAGNMGVQMASVRRSQNRSQDTMRRADHIILLHKGKVEAEEKRKGAFEERKGKLLSRD